MKFRRNILVIASKPTLWKVVVLISLGNALLIVSTPREKKNKKKSTFRRDEEVCFFF